jgi:hypothetical protein
MSTTPPPPGAEDAHVDTPMPQRMMQLASSGAKDKSEVEQEAAAPGGTARLTAEDNTEATSEVATSGDGASLLDEEDIDELSDDPAPFAGRELINQEKDTREKFTPHDTDPTMIDGTIKLKKPDGSGWYILKCAVYEKREPTEEDKKKYKATECIFLPPMAPARAPGTIKPKKGRPTPKWERDLSEEYRWTRYNPHKDKTEVFEPKFAFRRFSAWTREYQFIYIGMKKLGNINPNNTNWMKAYSRWIEQIHRRMDADYFQEKFRIHWAPAETRAMLTGFNSYVHANGRDKFHKISVPNLQPILDAVNAVGGRNRGIDALKGQINSAHKTKNPSLKILFKTAKSYADRVKAGELIPRAERYPEHAIPLSEFPEDEPPKAKKSKAKTKKMKENTTSTLAKRGRSMGIQSTDEVSEVEVVPWTPAMYSGAAPAAKKQAPRKRKRGKEASDSEEEIIQPDSGSENEADDDENPGFNDGDAEDAEEGDVDEEEEAEPSPPRKKMKMGGAALERAKAYLANKAAAGSENKDADMHTYTRPTDLTPPSLPTRNQFRLQRNTCVSIFSHTIQ